MDEPTNQNEANTWAPRPAEEAFPALMTTLDTAQFLSYDARPGMTPDKARRAIRELVRNHGLPVAGRLGRVLLFNRERVLAWLEACGADADDDAPETEAA